MKLCRIRNPISCSNCLSSGYFVVFPRGSATINQQYFTSEHDSLPVEIFYHFIFFLQIYLCLCLFNCYALLNIVETSCYLHEWR